MPVKFATVNKFNAGLKQFDVATKFGLSKSAVSKIMKKHECEQLTITKKRGRKRKLPETLVRILERTVMNNNI